MDHYVPKSKGGKSTDNLVPSCQVCNLFKSDRDIESFREAISKMLDRDIAGRIIVKYFDVKRKPIRFWYEDNYDG